MFTETNRFVLITYALTTGVAFALWSSGYFLGAVMAILIGGGIAMAKPVVEQRRLLLRGTPVLLMFAIMLTSASGMVTAVDQIVSLFFGAPAPVDECAKAVCVSLDFSGV